MVILLIFCCDVVVDLLIFLVVFMVGVNFCFCVNVDVDRSVVFISNVLKSFIYLNFFVIRNWNNWLLKIVGRIGVLCDSFIIRLL